jgi:PAS domain S-box-containing protein
MVAPNSSSSLVPPPDRDATGDAVSDALFAQPGFGVARLDAAGTVVRANAALAELTGVTVDRLVGRPFAAILHPEDADAPLAPGRSDKRIVRASGQVAYATLSVAPLRDGTDGRIVVVADTTDAHHAAQALAEARGRFESALVASEIGTFVWVLETDRVFGDANFSRIFGVVPDPDGGATAWEYARFIHEDDRAHVDTAVRRTIDTGEPYAVEYRIVLGGRTRWVDARGRVERGAAGQVVRFLGVVFDVSARKLQDEQNRAREDRDHLLQELDALTRDTTDPVEIMRAVTRRVAERFGSHRCAYADVAPDEEHFVIQGDYAAEGYTSSAGAYLLSGFGKKAATDMRAGRTLVVRDVDRELGPDGAGFRAIDIAAVIVTPLIRGGRLVAMMALHQGVPRDWTEAEQTLMAAVVERSWAFIERARADRERADSEDRFRLMANSIPQLAWMARPDGHIFWYNQRWYDYTGTTFEQMQGWGWESVHDPAELPRVVAGWKAAHATGESWEDTFPLRRHDGQMRWHLSRAQPLKDAEGEVILWFGTNTDVTESRRAAETLRASQERYRDLFESIDQGFCVIEVLFDDAGAPVDYTFVEVNPAFETQTGLTDAVGTTARGRLPSLEEHWFHAYGNVATTGTPVRFENFAQPMGRWFDVNAFRVGGAGSRRVAILFRDVTHAKGAEQALRESEARFRNMSDNAPVMIWVTRPDGLLRVPQQAVVRLHRPDRRGGARAGVDERGPPRRREARRRGLPGVQRPSGAVHDRVPTAPPRRGVSLVHRLRHAAVRRKWRVPRLRRLGRRHHRARGRRTGACRPARRRAVCAGADGDGRHRRQRRRLVLPRCRSTSWCGTRRSRSTFTSRPTPR